MTREEAIDILNTETCYECTYGCMSTANCENEKCPLKKAVLMAIKALEKEPCEDCISRQAVLDGLASIAKAKAKSDAQKSLMGRIMFFSEQLPSVQPKTKTGHWINLYSDSFKCSECGDWWQGKEITECNYCPNCGAKMEG